MIGGYQLLNLVGKGGMGTVYRAISPSRETVAVKILAPHLTGNDVLRSRFYLEARLAMALDHPNIVRALDVGEDNGRHFLVMEYIDGESVNKRIAREGVIPEEEAIKIIAAVARALDRAHSESLVHRDVKPDNILLTKDGQVKLTDLGLAKKAEIDLDLTRTGKGLGTPHFMAPEQFHNAKNVDPLSDIYALGATLYVMITGKLPFRGTDALDTFMRKNKNLYTPVEEILPGVDPRVLKVIRYAMAADPRKRPCQAAQIGDYLERKGDKLVRGTHLEAHVEYVEPTWYIKFDDGPGGKSRIRGPESTIIGYIARGKVGPEAHASQSKKGPFQPIGQIAAFQESLRQASAAGAASRSGRIVSRPASTSSTSGRFVAPSTAPTTHESWIPFFTTVSVGLVVLLAIGWYLLFQ
jgi:eukaryotic-like serine/threonine-protein kinase